MKRGRELARNKETELVIKNEDGRIAQKDSYGNDPLNGCNQLDRVDHLHGLPGRRADLHLLVEGRTTEVALGQERALLTSRRGMAWSYR